MGPTDAEHHHLVEQWFQGLGDECLQLMSLDRQFTQASHPPESGGIASDRKADLVPANHTPARFESCHPTVFAQHTGDLTVLDDIDTTLICGTRVTPGNRVMACAAGTALRRGPDDRETGIRTVIQMRNVSLERREVPQFTVGIGQAHSVVAPCCCIAGSRAVDQAHVSPLTEHHVVI